LLFKKFKTWDNSVILESLTSFLNMSIRYDLTKKGALPKGLFVYLIILDKLHFFYFYLVCIYRKKYFVIKDIFFLLPAPLGSKYLSYEAASKIKRQQLTDKIYFVVN